MRISLPSVLRALLVLAVASLATAAAAQAATPKAYVDLGGVCQANVPCYTSIQLAVDESAPGTVILVYPGTYHEHVVVNKTLTLHGQDATIDGDGTGTVLSLTASGSAIEGLALTNGGVGVGLYGASNDRLAHLNVTNVAQGLFFASGATGNLVTKTEVGFATSFTVNVGDQGNSGNRFLQLNLHDSASGLNAYAGSSNLVLEDSTIWNIAPGTGVQIGFSGGWTVEHNEILDSANGIVTDSVSSGSITHNYIAGSENNGIFEAGYQSTVVTHENRIEGNGQSGIALCIAARDNDVRGNVIVDNARYGVEICGRTPPYSNTGNTVSGNYLFSGAGTLGDALDDQGSNAWSGNYYSRNVPWSAPFTIPGTAGAQDANPLTQADLPTPASKNECKKDGWWLLTDGEAPFETQGACVSSTTKGHHSP